MSLAIDVDAVTAVLLADGWHRVAKKSFFLDSYEYLWSGREGTKVKDLRPDQDHILLHGGGQSGISATGFSFLEQIDRTGIPQRISGPLTAILAVRYDD